MSALHCSHVVLHKVHLLRLHTLLPVVRDFNGITKLNYL